MKAIAFIPCKTHSRRIPNKNFMLLDNKPLFMHTLHHLLDSLGTYEEIVIDSDDPSKVGKYLKKYHLENHPRISNHARPQELAKDNTPITAPIIDYLTREEQRGHLPEYTFMVYPTAVLLDIYEMEYALDLLEEHPEWLSINNVVPGPNPDHSLALIPTTNEAGTTFEHAHWQIRKEEFKNSTFPQAFYPAENWELVRSKALIGNPRFYDLKGPCVVSNPRKCIALDNPEDIEIMKAFYYYEKMKNIFREEVDTYE